MTFSANVPTMLGALSRWWNQCQIRLRELWRAKSKRRSLFVTETATLGERRFVAVVQFERKRFLIGGSAGSVTLLAQLPEEDATSPAEATERIESRRDD